MGELSVAEVLNRAADLIEPEGAWTQGTYGLIGDGEYRCLCLYGAVREAARGYPRAVPKGCMSVLDGLCDNDPVGWNDTPGRTQAEVVAKLREAAALALSTPAVRIEDGGGRS